MVDAGAVVLGLLLVGIGVAGIRYAYWLSRVSERIDAIGSTTPWHEVEPAGWRVAVTRAMFAGLGLLGAGVALSALLG
jgi:hypothetical protein